MTKLRWSVPILLVSVLFLMPSVCGAQEVSATYEKGYRIDMNGWVYVHIEGDAYERGFQNGYLVAPELKTILRSIKYLTYFNTGKKWEFFVEAGEELFVPHIDDELLNEIKGIAAGAQKAGVDITWQEVVAWNGYMELVDYWWPNAMEKYKYTPHMPGAQDHCSAFMATGKATHDGRIVMAHNSFDNFEEGQFFRVIIDIEPSEGNRILMQSMPGYIHSGTDFFVTSAQIMGTETTLGGFSLYREKEVPEFVRIRKSMQYAKTLDEFVDMMKKHNSGGYANAWLLGDIRTGEIMRFEQGLEFTNVERKSDGYFIGFNAPIDPRIRNLECANTGYADIRRHQGARQVRLEQLMQEHYGKIDVEIAKEIIADHYDVYLKKINPSSRTVDGHYELDAREYMSQPGRPLPYHPRGAVDGKVGDSVMAAQMSFWARWGNSSGMPFDADAFLDEHIQWSHLRGYLYDRPAQPWTKFKAGMK